jgi:hypothetical protein
MDDMKFDSEISWQGDELCLLSGASPAYDPVIEMEQMMMNKYNVDRSFVKLYIKHAAERTNREVMRNYMLLPPGREDRLVIEKCVAQAQEIIRKHDLGYRTQMNAVTEAFQEISHATNEKEKKALEVKADAMAIEYFKMSTQAWKAVHTLYKCSEMVPIDAKEFHADMREFIRILISSNMRRHFPHLADQLM